MLLFFFTEVFPLSVFIIDEILCNKTDIILDKHSFLRYNIGTVYERKGQTMPSFAKEQRMPKNTGQKLRILHLLEILKRKTDDHHSLTTAEIITSLSRYGITADRKTVYDDLQALEDGGMDLLRAKGKNGGVKLLGRDFDLAEVKMLVDAVQSSHFITEKKSRSLIKKLGALVSEYQEKALARHFYNGDRIKSDNSLVLYTVDAINEAINENRKLSFRYWKWNHEKKKEFRREGNAYLVSPWELTIDDNNYYLIAYDDKNGELRHFRVDKMTDVTPTELPRTDIEALRDLNLPDYRAPQFGMFGGKPVTVKIKAPLSMAGVFIDRFGQDVIMHRHDEKSLTVRVSVCESPQFFGWLFGLGAGVSILEPADLRAEYIDTLKTILEDHREE